MTLAEPKPDPRQALGRSGESAAERALVEDGYRILERRYRCRVGEIDLIAERDGVVVFVEVKARTASLHGTPADAVGPVKQRRLARVALHFLARHGWLERPTRFDVVEVLPGPAEGSPEVRRIEDAFRLRGPFGRGVSW